MDRDGWNIPALQQLGVPWRIVNRRAYTTHSGERVAATSYWWHLPARPFWKATDELADEGANRIVAWVYNPLA
jgi:ligand-binding SRPBCC domain-containing protein